MIKKQLLVILATIVLSFSAFAQFSGGDGSQNNPYKISTADDLLEIDDNSTYRTKYFKQTADINLGDLGTLPTNNAIINGTFSGTYDGGGHSISYSVKFFGDDEKESFGLFEEVSGTIKNLRITSSSAMLSGTGKDMNVGLICGVLLSNGVITDCHVAGNINSTVDPKDGNGVGSDAGLIVGQSLGKIKYSSGTGNVVGVGYAGGLVGQLNDAWGHYNGSNNGEIIGCSFVGSVKAVPPKDYTTNNGNKGSFAGGICGFVAGSGVADPEISLSYANATLEGNAAYGLAYFSNLNNGWGFGNYGSCNNIYVKGTVNGDNIDNADEISNRGGTNRYNNANNNNEVTNSTLNGVVDNTNEANQKIYFSKETGEIILVFGRPITTSCAPPQGLNITAANRNGYKLYTAQWTSENSADYVYELKKVDNGSIITYGTISDGNSNSISITLGADGGNGQTYTLLEPGEYVLSVRRICNNGASLSDYATAAINIPSSSGINVNCTSVEELSASNITYNSATITWTATTGTYEFKLNDGEVETLTTNSKYLTGLYPNTLYKVEVRSVCSSDSKSLVKVIEFVTLNATFEEVPFVTVTDGNFEQPGTWNRNSVPTGNNEGIITIKHEVVLNSTLTLNGNTTINIDHSGVNKGVLKIDQQGQLITTSTTNDVTGIVEILTPIIGQKKWAFLGAPFVSASNDAKEYKLETIMPERGSDIIVSFYEYGSHNDWSADRDVYATYQYVAKTGEGYLGFPFYDGVVSFTSYGDLWDFTANNNTGGIKEYDATPALYKLNNSNVTITNEESNKWTPLSNPYPAKLSISKFLSENSYTIQEQVVCKFQGQGVYKLANADASAFDLVLTGEIKMTEGFFVKLASGQTSVNFLQTQLEDYPTTSQKSAVEREFIELSLVQNNHASKLYFAHNEQAEQGYDIFDADKLFAMTEMTEPYFVTDGISLVKEEVKELPYYATMNVRSFEHDSVSFVANNIPEGYSVSIIDGEETIELTENSAYSTLVSRGENANRFKVLIKKSVGLGEVEELEVEITNSNRLVNVSSTEEDLQIEVYNALGQKVFATKERNFTLNNVSAGAYVVKAFNNKASKTQKIVIK
jgi:hypothetical protein